MASDLERANVLSFQGGRQKKAGAVSWRRQGFRASLLARVLEDFVAA